MVDRIIGSEESIKTITIEDLLKAKKAIFKSSNAIISIQTSLKPEAKILKKLESLANKIPKGRVGFKVKKENFVNKYKGKYFVNEKAQGVEITIGRFRPIPPKRDYKRIVASYLFNSLIYYMSYMYLRDVKGLIYGVNMSTSTRGFNFTSTIISFNVDKSKFAPLLDELVLFIKSKLFEFLDSKDGFKWLQGQIIKYIFTTTINYDGGYAASTAMNLLTKSDYTWDFKLAQRVAKNATTDFVKDRVKEFLIDSQLFVWIEGPFEEKEVMGFYKKSKLYRELSKRK